MWLGRDGTISRKGDKILRTLVLAKPDAVQRGLTGEIISRIERKGLRIVALKMLQMDKALAKRHYAVHEGKPFFADLVDFITSGPIVAVVVEGEKAVEVVRTMMGDTDPKKSAPGTIRGDFGLDIGQNLIHGSDSEENARKEINLFFPGYEMPAKPD
jgi:nucleoside-diphosphate kinase